MTYILLLVTVIVVPVLLWLHQRLVEKKRHDGGGEPKGFRLVFSLWTVLAVLLVLVLIGILVYLEPPPPVSPEFTWFDLADYKSELESLYVGGSPTRQEFEELVRIFSHAERLVEIRDLGEAEAVLTSLTQGSDSSGSFPKVDSYSVSNNLGIISFKLRRNSKFLAVRHLDQAVRNPRLTEDGKRRIIQNIDRLDVAVNTLD